jgi:hypothetical protein
MLRSAPRRGTFVNVRHGPGRHARRRASAGAPSSLKLLDVEDVTVGNFLRALVIAPGLVDVASLFR